MAIRYVKDFEFPSAAGYTKSSPSKVTGQMYAKGGDVKKPKNMAAYKHFGFWQCMDTLRDKYYLEEIWRKGNAPWKILKK